MTQTTKLDKQFLTDVGITGLSDEEVTQTLQSLAETLEMRVGMALASQLSDEELKKVPDEIDENWLAENIPDYQTIADREINAMKDELTKSVAENKKLVEDA